MTFKYLEVTPGIIRPIIPILLKKKGKIVIYTGLIDSGADYCIFSTEIANVLGIKLSRQKVNFLGIAGTLVIGYWGEAEMRVGNRWYKLKAIFADISDFGHGVLGQKGFFDHFSVCLNYRKQDIRVESPRVS